MKKFALVAAVALAASAAVFTGVSAANGRDGDESVGTVTVSKSQTHDGSLFGAGGSVLVNGTVNGDVYCAGQNLTINGVVEGDVICAGQTVMIDGTVNGDVRVAGQTVTINGNVEGSVSAIGQTILVGKDAVVGRDFTGVGQTYSIYGKVGRDIVLGAQQITLDGDVGRNLYGSYEAVAVLGGAKVAGNAIFEANTADIAEGTVAGETKRTTPPAGYGENENYFLNESGLLAAFKTLQSATLFVLAMLLVLLLPGYVRRATQVNLQRFILATLLGIAVIVVTPIVAFMIALTVIGLPIAVIAGAAWIVMLMLSLPVFGYYVGRSLLQKYASNSITIMAVGMAVVLLAMLVPYIGGLVAFVGTSAGVGLTASALARRWVRPNYRHTVGK